MLDKVEQLMQDKEFEQARQILLELIEEIP